MRVITNRKRAERLMRAVVADLELTLAGMNVLTEAASGPFAVTALLAALAGADRVFAVTRDSAHGQASEVIGALRSWAEELGVDGQITFSTRPAQTFAPESHIVTNLGFVRPINAALIERLPRDAAVSLMWEPWEFRPGEVDLAVCRERGIPVLGTRETHPRLNIFKYLGVVAQKLLLEAEVEIFNARILLAASEPFRDFVAQSLNNAGAMVYHLSPDDLNGDWEAGPNDRLAGIDAVVVYEHCDQRRVIGETEGIPPQRLAENGVAVIHVCGNVDDEALQRAGVTKFPSRSVEPGFMTVTTDYAGPRPVIDLHAAGLKVGELLVGELRQSGDMEAAKKAALASGLGADFE